MQYTCEKCKYMTTDKSNYVKHLATNKHTKNSYDNSDMININEDEITTPKYKKYICDICKKNFSTSSNLSRHMKYTKGCKPPETDDEIIKLRNDILIMKNMLIKLLDYAEKYKLVTYNINNNISIKNYIEPNYFDTLKSNESHNYTSAFIDN